MSKAKISQPKHVLDNRSNQLNPQHPEFYRSRGIDPPLAERFAEHRGNPGQLPDDFRRKSQKISQPK